MRSVYEVTGKELYSFMADCILKKDQYVKKVVKQVREISGIQKLDLVVSNEWGGSEHVIRGVVFKGDDVPDFNMWKDTGRKFGNKSIYVPLRKNKIGKKISELMSPTHKTFAGINKIVGYKEVIESSRIHPLGIGWVYAKKKSPARFFISGHESFVPDKSQMTEIMPSEYRKIMGVK